ncbi:hypothetical protein G3H63_13110 [Microbacterium resistens]|uniref:hypothetical protein n=1 Tax=Microbacterium resistens TaxID=156977 RepID=UPI001C575CDD|nr:hypothetical protein [Microbacterium resistens]MBW1640004.1 hypothetical protein [Microbacterium resistens]
MILAGFALLAIGLADVLRRFVPTRARWFAIAVAGLAVLILAAIANAAWFGLLALALGALWLWAMPSAGRAPLASWPAVLLAVLCAAGVAFGPARKDAGVFGDGWVVPALGGAVPFDLVVLAVGVFAVMLETGNVVVRAALESEHAILPADADADAGARADARAGADADAGARADARAGADAPAPVREEGFRGGRLIGPLERVIVLLLTLAAAYPLLAAMLAAKGIVRFPEISRDGHSGARAEYFLVGSLVSWVVALGGAFLLWWASA